MRTDHAERLADEALACLATALERGFRNSHIQCWHAAISTSTAW